MSTVHTLSCKYIDDVGLLDICVYKVQYLIEFNTTCTVYLSLCSICSIINATI